MNSVITALLTLLLLSIGGACMATGTDSPMSLDPEPAPAPTYNGWPKVIFGLICSTAAVFITIAQVQ